MWMVKRREKTEFRKILGRIEVMKANKWFCKTLHKMFSIQGIKKISYTLIYLYKVEGNAKLK